MNGYTPTPRRRRSESYVKASRQRPAVFPARVVLVLFLLLIVAILALMITRGSLHRLRAQREEAALEYDRLVARHTVRYREWIEKYALENGIEPAYVAAIILRESSYDPQATSSVGARGLMQVMEDTFDYVRRNLGESTIFDDMYDPETNIRYGCWYLGNLSRIFDSDPIEMACAYHAGPNNVKLWIMNYAADQKNLRLEEIPMQDTRQYAGKVYDAYAIYFQHYYPDPV
ncbi:MAG: lytic transglycosylase domain-containing protein [Clostridia bacterium]|nr:lytic transglycosylase domain-containing protein [Clostridia bacterium]